VVAERAALKRHFDAFSEKRQSWEAVDRSAPKPDFSQMTGKQLMEHKEKQEQKQEELLQ
jgi:hypothetical protein